MERRLISPALDCYLSLNYVPGPMTLVEGIEKLPPGELLEWRDGKVRTEVLLEAAAASQPAQHILGRRERQLDSLLRPVGSRASAFRRAARCLAERWSRFLHHPALRRRGLRPKLKTFSISFQGRSFDESRYIREVADALRYRTPTSST